MAQCPINPRRSHTERFEKIYSALHDELVKRNLSGVDDDDVEELTMALSVLVADALDIDVYE
ncbi:MAG: hypothetical protein K8I29_17435 [Alphaproteobacteria bacterium]|uniref:Uncharacterized protein n=1 Tax=Candidatus Nitrobium versatile TaxID=2884831 RepID=A0A953M2Y3_9BACT|nr:hypothetical protein [Candidatus Nitrobium versatile]